ncbi:MAG: hypothetical protein HQM10_23700 [Candidatus Riflebacteria bacterium]|nr:hypothetical protein [Candidatus Riflebacteria bacterium]
MNKQILIVFLVFGVFISWADVVSANPFDGEQVIELPTVSADNASKTKDDSRITSNTNQPLQNSNQDDSLSEGIPWGVIFIIGIGLLAFAPILML